MRRSIILWAAVGALVIAGFVSTVLILNASLYSPAGFVRGYLDARARHDAEGALELAGPSVAGDASTALLQRDALGELSGIRLVLSRRNKVDAVGGEAVGVLDGQIDHGQRAGVERPGGKESKQRSSPPNRERCLSRDSANLVRVDDAVLPRAGFGVADEAARG